MYIIKTKIGTHVQLRPAENKEEAIALTVKTYNDFIAKGNSVVFSKDGECLAQKYEVSIAVFEGDKVRYPTFCGGDFRELDAALANKKPSKTSVFS